MEDALGPLGEADARAHEGDTKIGHLGSLIVIVSLLNINLTGRVLFTLWFRQILNAMCDCDVFDIRDGALK